jgi:hypothetical protein
MSTTSTWTVLSSAGIGGAAGLAVEAGKYVLSNGTQQKSLFWVGAGVNVSIEGLPLSVAASTPRHWSAPGKVFFSKMAPHRINPSLSPEMVFSGNGLVIEIGANSALADVLFVGPYIRDWARAHGVPDWQNQACGQMLLFNTTNNLFGTVLGVGLADILTILGEIAATGDYSSIYTQGVAFVASASSGIDTAGITVTQGGWFLW